MNLSCVGKKEIGEKYLHNNVRQIKYSKKWDCWSHWKVFRDGRIYEYAKIQYTQLLPAALINNSCILKPMALSLFACLLCHNYILQSHFVVFSFQLLCPPQHSSGVPVLSCHCSPHQVTYSMSTLPSNLSCLPVLIEAVSALHFHSVWTNYTQHWFSPSCFFHSHPISLFLGTPGICGSF